MTVLESHGFSSSAAMPEHVYFERYHQRIEISFIERTQHNQIITPGRWADWPWTHDAFLAGERTLHGVRCPVTSLESVLTSKRDFAAHAPDQPLREKDRLDMVRVSSTRNERDVSPPRTTAIRNANLVCSPTAPSNRPPCRADFAAP